MNFPDRDALWLDRYSGTAFILLVCTADSREALSSTTSQPSRTNDCNIDFYFLLANNATKSSFYPIVFEGGN
jgi:hypothetical protein